MAQDKNVVADTLGAFINTGTPREAIAVLRDRSDALLSDDALELLDLNLARYGADAEAQAIFALRKRAIVAARERGIDAGVAELYRPDAQLQQLVDPLVNAPSHADMVQRLRATPALLTADVVEYLGVLATWNAGNPAARNVIDVARTLVDTARTKSIDEARRWLLGQLIDSVQQGPGTGARAVSGWESALQLTDPDAEAVTRAQIQVNLAQAYRERGEEGDGDRAIDALERALVVLTREDHPAHFSGIHRVLGNIHFGDTRVPEETQCTRAVQHYDLALATTSADADPQNFLHVNFMLATCWQTLNQPERTRAHLRSGLEAVDRADLGRAIETCATLAEAMNGAGTRTAEALHAALATLSARVDALPPDADPNARAAFYDTLGNVYRELVGPWRAEDLERAIAATTAAAGIWTRDVDADHWARMQHNLGAAYYARVEQEKADNIEQAIQCYQNALTVHTREGYPSYWALTHNALGAAWLARKKGQPDDNAEVAAQIFEQALTVWNPERDAFYWGECYNALGGANLRLVPRRGRVALSRAIECFEHAAQAHTRERFPSRWAQLQNNLANAYLQRQGPGDAVQAIVLLQQAIAATDRTTESYLWATFKRNEGAAHSQATESDTDAHLDAAISSLEEALSVFDADRYPAEHRDTQAGLGKLWFRREAWQEALAANRAAIAAAERIFDRAYTETGRLSEAQELSTIYRDAAFCLVRLGQPNDALVLHDRGKTRVLMDAIELAQARFDDLPPAQREEAARARQEIVGIEDQMRFPEGTAGRPSDAVLGRSIAQARERLRQAVGKPALADGGVEGLLGLIPADGALVAPLLTSRGGIAFVVPYGVQAVTDAHVLPLSLDADEANDLLVGSDERPGLLRTYAEYLSEIQIEEDRDTSPEAFNRYLHQIEETCRRLWTVLMRPIFERLQTYDLELQAPVLMVPHGALALLPLHAATATREPAFLRRFSVQYSPSLAVMAQTQARLAKARPTVQLLAVADPGGDLEFAGIECGELARLFGRDKAVVLAGAAATVEAVVGAVGACSHLHFSCHGFYDWRDPLRSGLVLADGRLLDVAELMSPRVDLGVTRLVVLSACETGLSDYARYPDEYVGLNSGLLLAGAPAVVSTLWAVDDRSTSLLMSEFYRRLLDGESVATALGNAQLWLSGLTFAGLKAWELERRPQYQPDADNDRAADLAGMHAASPEARPYEHPYYWAAFTAIGAA